MNLNKLNLNRFITELHINPLHKLYGISWNHDVVGIYASDVDVSSLSIDGSVALLCYTGFDNCVGVRLTLQNV